MDCPWLHCNICTRLPYPSGCKFFFANCGHIACAKCVGKSEFCFASLYIEVF